MPADLRPGSPAIADTKPVPGLSRDRRICEQGLQRLERQLAAGRKISAPVLEQWIKRYGKAAREIIDKYS